MHSLKVTMHSPLITLHRLLVVAVFDNLEPPGQDACAGMYRTIRTFRTTKLRRLQVVLQIVHVCAVPEVHGQVMPDVRGMHCSLRMPG